MSATNSAACDPLVVPTNVEELGLGAASAPTGPFSAGEEITASAAPTIQTTCGLPAGSSVKVTMTNLTAFDLYDVWYAGDEAKTLLANFDGDIDALGGTCPSEFCLGFKIDSVGINQPLVFESMADDNIFESGEIWEFIIVGYLNFDGLPASAFNSVGVGSASSTPGVSSGSIIATIPEPGVLSLLTSGLLGLGLLERRRRET